MDKKFEKCGQLFQKIFKQFIFEQKSMTEIE
jgi:hypothetical protein